MPLVYRELHRSARRYMAGERSGHTLQTTALINEVYLRLVDINETAVELQVSSDTVMRDWKMAKVWLLRELGKGERHAT